MMPRDDIASDHPACVRCDRARGVTLLEVTIAISIFSLMGLVFFSIGQTSQHAADLTNATFHVRTEQQRVWNQLLDYMRENMVAIHSVNGEMKMANGLILRDMLVYYVDEDHDGNRDGTMKAIGLLQQDMDGDGVQDFLDVDHDNVQDVTWEPSDWKNGSGQTILWNKEPFMFEVVTGDVAVNNGVYTLTNMRSWCRNVRSDGNSIETPGVEEVPTYGLFEFESDQFEDNLDANADGVIQEFEIGNWNNGNAKIDNLLIQNANGGSVLVSDDVNDLQDQYTSAVVETAAINSVMFRLRVARLIGNQRLITISSTTQLYPRNWEN